MKFGLILYYKIIEKCIDRILEARKIKRKRERERERLLWIEKRGVKYLFSVSNNFHRFQ